MPPRAGENISVPFLRPSARSPVLAALHRLGRLRNIDIFRGAKLQFLVSGRRSQIGKAAACKAVYSRFESGRRLQILLNSSRCAESAISGGRLQRPDTRYPWASGGMAYTTDLKSVARKGLRVQIPPRLPFKTKTPVKREAIGIERGLLFCK